MSCCFLVIASLENGSADLTHSFFNIFLVVRIRFIGQTKLEKLLGEIRKKLKGRFSFEFVKISTGQQLKRKIKNVTRRLEKF